MSDKLTHLTDQGHAQMVDIGHKPDTKRIARAIGAIKMSSFALEAVRNGNAPKGDVLGAARIAGIMAAKKTPDLIPLCHTLTLNSVNVDFAYLADGISVIATVSTTGKTGVEMEAITAACVSLLTIYDMTKALDKAMVIGNIRLAEKHGGKSGPWIAKEIGK